MKFNFLKDSKKKRLLLVVLVVLSIVFLLGFLFQKKLNNIFQSFTNRIRLISSSCDSTMFYKDTAYCFKSESDNVVIKLNEKKFIELMDSLDQNREFNFVTVIHTDEIQNSYSLIYENKDTPSESFGYTEGAYQEPTFRIHFDRQKYLDEGNSNSHKFSRLFIHAYYQMMNREKNLDEVMTNLSSHFLDISNTSEAELPFQIQ